VYKRTGAVEGAQNILRTFTCAVPCHHDSASRWNMLVDGEGIARMHDIDWRNAPSSSLSAAANSLRECDPRNSVSSKAGITIPDTGGPAEEVVGMNRLIGVALVALVALTQPAPSYAGTTTRQHAAGAQKEKPTPPPRSSYLSCKKYFPLIGAIVSVPCSG
jgi:hypothetical protein